MSRLVVYLWYEKLLLCKTHHITVTGIRNKINDLLILISPMMATLSAATFIEICHG